MERLQPLHRYTEEEYSKIIQELFEKNPQLQKEKSLYIYSKKLLQARLQHLEKVFPKNVSHAVAIKTNSLPQVLEEIVKSGHGLEAASFEEVELAVQAGCSFDKIVFDSPVKTQEEIDACNEKYPNILINANCLEELDRLEKATNVRVGIRINPLVNVGSPSIYDVSGNHSKFGIPIHLKEKIKQKAFEIPHVQGLHVHAGSEIGNPQGHIEAIGRIFDLAEEINTTQAGKITILDIGGGFPAKMTQGEQEGLEHLVEGIKERCKDIFRKYQVITEYGRFVHAHNAFVISQVEYILTNYQPNIALIHVGADLFPREIYSIQPPHHDLLVLNPCGTHTKSLRKQIYDIGGPLCFSGDFLCRGVELGKLQVSDYILVMDCGANTISMWSQHCSRHFPRVTLY